MGKFDRVYLDEVVTATSPAEPGWIEELRREYRTGSEDEAARKLWEWFDETNPSIGRRSRGAMSDLIDKTTAEANGEPWRVRNVGRTVVDGCVDHHQQKGKSPLDVLLQIGWPPNPAEVPLCLAGPNHPYRTAQRSVVRSSAPRRTEQGYLSSDQHPT